jgi:hypothetical protein
VGSQCGDTSQLQKGGGERHQRSFTELGQSADLACSMAQVRFDILTPVALDTKIAC